MWIASSSDTVTGYSAGTQLTSPNKSRTLNRKIYSPAIFTGYVVSLTRALGENVEAEPCGGSTDHSQPVIGPFVENESRPDR
jgi:hypothetical protein